MGTEEKSTTGEPTLKPTLQMGMEENTHINVGDVFWPGASLESLQLDFSFDGMGKEDEAHPTNMME